jgi:flagellar hook-basal body protein
MESLDMLANNLANVSTTGFKIDREFYSLYAAPEAVARDGADNPQVLPTIDRSWTDLSQGSLQQTGKQLDLALDGRGFFTVSGSVVRQDHFIRAQATSAYHPQGLRLLRKAILCNSQTARFCD